MNDRGPFVRNRIIDLSTAAARRIGMLKDGSHASGCACWCRPRTDLDNARVIILRAGATGRPRLTMCRNRDDRLWHFVPTTLRFPPWGYSPDIFP
ncbi:septal ring lytic transglycosylase RlpA family protein [Stakelama sediminis]|nr:septal ring lytic transglycosylase RlpA family protein [Stakelama sediminis]